MSDYLEGEKKRTIKGGLKYLLVELPRTKLSLNPKLQTFSKVSILHKHIIDWAHGDGAHNVCIELINVPWRPWQCQQRCNPVYPNCRWPDCFSETASQQLCLQRAGVICHAKSNTIFLLPAVFLFIMFCYKLLSFWLPVHRFLYRYFNPAINCGVFS